MEYSIELVKEVISVELARSMAAGEGNTKMWILMDGVGHGWGIAGFAGDDTGDRILHTSR